VGRYCSSSSKFNTVDDNGDINLLAPDPVVDPLLSITPVLPPPAPAPSESLRETAELLLVDTDGGRGLGAGEGDDGGTLAMLDGEGDFAIVLEVDTDERLAITGFLSFP